MLTRKDLQDIHWYTNKRVPYFEIRGFFCFVSLAIYLFGVPFYSAFQGVRNAKHSLLTLICHVGRTKSSQYTKIYSNDICSFAVYLSFLAVVLSILQIIVSNWYMSIPMEICKYSSQQRNTPPISTCMRYNVSYIGHIVAHQIYKIRIAGAINS